MQSACTDKESDLGVFRYRLQKLIGGTESTGRNVSAYQQGLPARGSFEFLGS
jgi:hypothetical protein